LVQVGFPEFQFYPWLFDVTPRNFFKTVENRRKYIEWLLQTTKKTTLTIADFRENGGSGLLHNYKFSPSRILASLSEEDGNTKSFDLKTPMKYWDSLENQRAFLARAEKLIPSIASFPPNDLSKWYNVSRADLEKVGGFGLTKKYRGGLSKVFTTLFPNYDWQLWKFKISPRGSLKDPNTIHKAVKYVEKALEIMDPIEWHRISKDKIKSLGVEKVIDANGGVEKTLSKVYPELRWKT
jgi:hypothetical protein